MTKTYRLKPGVTTRRVLAAIREAHEHALTTMSATHDLTGVSPDEDRRRFRPFIAPGVRGDEFETRYVFGIHTAVRSTLTVAYTVGSGEIDLVFPSHYPGWAKADDYTRLRVHIFDRMRAVEADIIDLSHPPRVLGGAA